MLTYTSIAARGKLVVTLRAPLFIGRAGQLCQFGCRYLDTPGSDLSVAQTTICWHRNRTHLDKENGHEKIKTNSGTPKKTRIPNTHTNHLMLSRASKQKSITEPETIIPVKVRGKRKQAKTDRAETQDTR